MKRLILDTNVLLSFVTDRNIHQQECSRKIFEEALALKRILLISFHVLTEFTYVLDTVYGVERERIKEMIRELISYPGTEILYGIDMAALLDVWPETVPDYGDAVIVGAWAALKRKDAAVFTFDKKFQNILKKRLDIPVWIP